MSYLIIVSISLAVFIVLAQAYVKKNSRKAVDRKNAYSSEKQHYKELSYQFDSNAIQQYTQLAHQAMLIESKYELPLLRDSLVNHKSYLTKAIYYKTKMLNCKKDELLKAEKSMFEFFRTTHPTSWSENKRYRTLKPLRDAIEASEPIMFYLNSAGTCPAMDFRTTLHNTPLSPKKRERFELLLTSLDNAASAYTQAERELQMVKSHAEEFKVFEETNQILLSSFLDKS